jgi:hypothetical protein
MNKKFLIPAVVALSSAGTTAASDLTFVENYENVLGTSLEIKLGASSRVAADRAQLEALGEIARQSRILSSWDAKSEFSQWAQSHSVSRELSTLGLFDQWRVRTHALIRPRRPSFRLTSAARASGCPRRRAGPPRCTVRQPHWSPNVITTATHLRMRRSSSHRSRRAHHRAVAAAMRVPASTVVLNVGGTWCAARPAHYLPIQDAGGERHADPDRRPQRRWWRRAATTGAASTSPVSTTRTSSIRGPACRPAT